MNKLDKFRDQHGAYGGFINLIIRLYKLFYHKRINYRIIELLQEERALNVLQKYMYILDSYKEPDQLLKKNKIIWTCWIQGESAAPEIVKKCFESMRKWGGEIGYKVIILTEENLTDYVEIPEYVIDKFKRGIITNTHFSDIFRLLVLAQKGGIWIDANTYISGKASKENFRCLDLTLVDSNTLFMLKSPMNLTFPRVSSSWLIGCLPGDEVISKSALLLCEYWKYECSYRAYFLAHMCVKKVVENDLSCKRKFRAIPYFDDSEPCYLCSLLSDKYSQVEWDYIKKMSCIHKLNSKIEFETEKEGSETYYKMLIENRL